MNKPKTESKKPAATEAVKEISPFRKWADRPDDQAMAELVEFLISNSTDGNLAEFTRRHGFVYVTVLNWINADPKRTEMYAHAREERADRLADEIVAISDEECTMVRADKHGSKDEDGQGYTEVVFDPTAVARNRLRVEARKWAASKLKPRMYGDKVAIGGAADLPPIQGAFTMTEEQLLAIAATGRKNDAS